MVSVAAGTKDRSIPATSPLLLRGAATAGAAAAAHGGAGARGGGTELPSEWGKCICCLVLVFQFHLKAFSTPGAAAGAAAGTAAGTAPGAAAADGSGHGSGTAAADGSGHGSGTASATGIGIAWAIGVARTRQSSGTVVRSMSRACR